jgi:hypothetical protein
LKLPVPLNWPGIVGSLQVKNKNYLKKKETTDIKGSDASRNGFQG